MVNDKRTGEQVSVDELRGQLNEEQRMTLGELELLGWTLKFVRMPLFQDPVPVVVSNDNSQIGMLDPEGKIVVDQARGIRDEEPAIQDTNTDDVTDFAEVSIEAEAEAESAAEEDWVEKRRGDSPVPDNLEDYLNGEQMTALRQIQAFGWELKFVRRPLFQEPIAVIINNDGDVGIGINPKLALILIMVSRTSLVSSLRAVITAPNILSLPCVTTFSRYLKASSAFPASENASAFNEESKLRA